VIYVEPNGYAGYDSADLYGYYSGDPNSDASDNQFLFSFRGPYYWDNAISWNTCENCEFGAIPVINQGYGDHPVNGVSPEGARAFCEYYGLRLTNEYEWEKAARGMTGYDYPWGDSWDSSYLNHSESGDPWEGGILSDGPLVGILAATTPAGYYNGTTYTYPDGFPNGEDQDSYTTSESASPYGVYES
jgi:formylglycine-generating enzyme required for sulfatase activity